MKNAPHVSYPRLAVILSHPTQYYSPWFRWLASNTDLPFRVFYLWQFGVTEQRDRNFEAVFKWDIDLLSGYEHEFVPNVSRDPGTHHFRGLRNPQLTERLEAWQPDALLLFGYNSESHVRAIAWARRRKRALLFRGDSHLLGRGAPRGVRRLLLRTLYAQFAAFLPVGAANRAYFSAFGVPEQKLFPCPHSVNDALFDPTDAAHVGGAQALRQSLGLGPNTRVVLFAGKLIPAKQPRELLQAFLALNQSDTVLVFVGDGPEKAALVEIASLARTGNVRFLPFANQTEMPARYLLADLLVLPSRGHYETWGLSVNEAMHMGVPALVSDLVGCQQDLVTDGDTGWVFAAFGEPKLRDKLGVAVSYLQDEPRRQSMRQRVLQRISGYTYAASAAGLLGAVRSVVAAPK